MSKEKIYVPPLKIQGIKTKLIPIIKETVKIDEDTVWIEPFMGSGVVGFNIAPQKAIFADTNPYIIKNRVFICQSFEKTIEMSKDYEKAFIYCDPPYLGRNANYYDGWNEEKEVQLKEALIVSKKQFMVSTWDYNQYRKNEYLEKIWNFCEKVNIEHFYHIGAKENNRTPIIEALLLNYNIM